MLSTLLCSMVTLTGPALDIKVDGQGLLRFARDGRAVYAKHAHLTIEDGHLVAAHGVELLPAITAPDNASKLEVDLEGHIFAICGGSKTKLGKLVLAGFSSEGALTADGAFLIAPDRPNLGEAGEDLFGVIRPEEGDGTPQVAQAPVVIHQHTEPIVGKHIDPLPPLPGTVTVAPYKTRAAQQIKQEIPVITLKVDGEAKGDKILVGEVANVQASDSQKAELENIPVGDTPVVGVNRGIDGPTIIAGLSRAGWAKGTYVLNPIPGAHVHRQSQTVENAAFLDAAKQGIADQFQIKIGFHCDVEQPSMACPMGVLSLKTESCSKTTAGITVIVGAYVDGKRINGRTLLMTPDKDAVGVKAGQIVKLILKAGGAVVEYSGKAKEQAWVGQSVSVETDTGAILKGTVQDDGSVEVQL
jgi:flagellar basal body P-ring formation chaperone FlgA